MLISTAVFAQQKRVETSIDTTKNKIGAQFNLTLKTNVDTLSNVVFPSAPNFGRLEVIRSYVIDTIKKGDRYELIKRYGLTQFDSGRYTIPSLRVIINNKSFLTDSIAIDIANVSVDTLKQKMFDIKSIATEPSDNSFIWKILLGLLLIGTIGTAIYLWTKKRKPQQEVPEIYKTPIEKATSLLQNLEKKALWQKGEIKAYYSELTDIARNYIEEAIEIPAMESTTSELILGLRAVSVKKKMALSTETLENLEKVLKQADLVKFAKSRPLEFEIAEDCKKIEKAILTLDHSIPVVAEIEEDSVLNAAQKQQQAQLLLKKQRHKRIVRAIVAVVLLLFFTTTYMIVTKGFDYFKDTILGNSSKELLEEKWVFSEYGNPSVAIETPKVLKRIDLTQTLPKEGMALIKEMQSFAYGSISDHFYLMVSTIKYKQEGAIDLSKSLENALETLEYQGAQNVIVKQDDFGTKQGITGIKGYGTFSTIDAIEKRSAKLYYEILVFGQEGGLQQIIIIHEEGDAYAEQISERVLNTVELKNAAE